MNGQKIRIVTSDMALGRALAMRVSPWTNGTPVLTEGYFEVVESGDVVITTAAECSPVECHLLSEGGVQVVILAPVLRESERERYIRAGARAYVVMQVDGSLLQGAVEDALMAEPVPVRVRPVC